MNFVGIDASFTRTAVASVGPDGFHYEVIETKPRRRDGSPWSDFDRCRYLSDRVYALLSDWPGGVAGIAVEEPGFTGQGFSTAAVAMARAAVFCGIPSGIRVEVPIVSRWRRDLAIHMRRGAGKVPIEEFVRELGFVLPVSDRGKVDPDVPDAVALAEWMRRVVASDIAPLPAASALR